MYKKNSGGAVLAGLLLAVAAAAHAEGVLQVQSPAVYDAAASVVPTVQRECVVDSMVAEHVFKKIAGKYPDAQQVQDPAKMESGKALKLTILSVQGIGGGGWTGSKGITVRADLVQDGRTVQTSVRKERSRGGLLGPVTGTCAILEEVGEALGQYFASWMAKVDSANPPALPTASQAKPAQVASEAQNKRSAEVADETNTQPEP